MVARREAYESPAIRAFAAELEAWRGTAGLSKVELAETLGYTPQLIGQLEAGKNMPSKKFAEDTDTHFTTNGLFVRLWKLINDTRHLAVLPPGFADYVARESEASRMYVFEPSVVKGIFQTPAYAYEVLKAGRTTDEVDQLVAKRMERQEILRRPRPPRIVAIFDEGVIRRIIGGTQVMRGQLGRLIEVAEQPHVTLQIVPSTTGAYAGLPGAFTILGFDDGPDLVYTEGHVGGQVVADGATIREYALRYDLIRGAAMSTDETLKLLHEVLESL
ncbi:helix-turn-helix transcriptional regulator [Actinoallomurus purpureus]|uniref:helix-turn-helix domain-containing protein n=1 Tax=Actinoallomurus purpureus TaxID=478114 RepID=UPI002092E752|nr:helix-turn-helix transcriptional regulator [Actinoallomurus purpureus]MCO6006296.1 helix-turn-helix transcriptional regulator [Actinoallomurus purpureus]